MTKLTGDMKIAKRLCDPKNYLATRRNTAGFATLMRVAWCARRVWGQAAKGCALRMTHTLLVLGRRVARGQYRGRAGRGSQECIRKYEQFRGWLIDDKTVDTMVIKRLCDPKNFVSNPNEYGWVCDYERGVMRVKGEGAKQRRDALCGD